MEKSFRAASISDASMLPPLPAPGPVGRPPPPPQNEQVAQQDAGTTFTLLVKHLPEALPVETLMRLFSHYGASDLRPCAAGRLKNCAFVDFKDESHAHRAQSQLHRLRFLGKILAVERAKPLASGKEANVSAQSRDGAAGKELLEEPPPPPSYPHPLEKPPLPTISTASRSTTGSVPEPIATSLGVDYPFPPHLEYAYPPPDGNILTNIVNALIAVPRFYTQVLHLMNKMNLPAPFRPALPTPPLPPPPPAPAAPKRQTGDLSSDESELESSEESGADLSCMDQGAEEAESKMVKKEATRKRLKREIRDGLAVDKVTAAEATGAKPIPLVPKEKAAIKKRQPVLQINISTKGLQGESLQEKKGMALEAFNDIVKEETGEPKTLATRAELEAGKMPLTEILTLPTFKNYAAGKPAEVLYIKNLAKDVVLEDLFYVFGALFTSADDAKAKLGVKLMQEGRMRGQAFVTFPSTELAEIALNAVHGFVLKGKPMIVQFGRNPSAPNASLDTSSQM